jgi:hypothetical protein
MKNVNTDFKNICYQKFIMESQIVKNIKYYSYMHILHMGGREHTFPIFQISTCTSVGLITIIKRHTALLKIFTFSSYSALKLSTPTNVHYLKKNPDITMKRINTDPKLYIY